MSSPEFFKYTFAIGSPNFPHIIPKPHQILSQPLTSQPLSNHPGITALPKWSLSNMDWRKPSCHQSDKFLPNVEELFRSREKLPPWSWTEQHPSILRRRENFLTKGAKVCNQFLGFLCACGQVCTRIHLNTYSFLYAFVCWGSIVWAVPWAGAICCRTNGLAVALFGESSEF